MPTVYITLPNTGTGSINIPAALYGYSGINCLTASVANYCYGFATGSYATFFNGSVSGSVGNQIQSGSAQKNDCLTCGTGSFYTTIVPANTYFSTTSLADANAQAIAYLTSVSQSNANTYGSCSYNYFYSNQISASVQKNDCGANGTGSFILITLPVSYSFDSCSQANAQNAAQAYFNSISQSQANASGSCMYYNTIITGSIQKNDCLTCGTGSFVNYTVSASTFSSSISYAIAQASASNYFNSTSQSVANASGSCTYNYFYSTAISASVRKNNCDFGYLTGSLETVTLPASYSVSSCSYAAAQSVAQTYFNSISQSQANASGSCLLLQRVYFQGIYDYVDRSLFPLTASYYTKASSSYVIPTENSPSWSIMGYITSSQLAYSSQSVTMSATAIMTQNGSGYELFKLRGNDGSVINIYPNNATQSGIAPYNLVTCIPSGGLYPCENGYINVSPIDAGFLSLSVLTYPIMRNSFTQSAMTSGDYRIAFNQPYFGPPYPSMSAYILSGGSSTYITASVLYTQSATFPSLTDSNWKVAGYLGNASAGVFRVYTIRNGSGSYTNPDIYDSSYGPGGPMVVSSSGYYYFKFQNVSGSYGPVPKLASEYSASYITGSSGSVLQFQFLSNYGVDGTHYVPVYNFDIMLGL